MLHIIVKLCKAYLEYKNVKISTYIFFASTLTAVSCATTQPMTTQNPAATAQSSTPSSVEDSTPVAIPTVTEEPPAPVIDEATRAYEAYRATVDGVTLSVVSSPKEVIAGQAFAAPYIVKAVNADASAVSGLKLTATYPVSRTDTTNKGIQTATETLTTEEDGTVSFSLPLPQRPFNDRVRFSPAVADEDAENEQIAALAAEKAVEAPYKVRTRYVRSGGSIALVDYTAAGKPITSNSESSSKLLAELMKKGFVGIGNADFTSQVNAGDRAAVYTAARRLFGNASAYLIYGTVKHAAPVEQTAGGVRATLTADVICLNMNDGSVLYSTRLTESAEAARDSAAITAARVALAKKLSEEIYYGM